MKIKRVSGFTLTEMLIVLAISTIVVGLAFAIISLFSKNVGHIQNNYQSSTENHLFQNQLTIDFNRYHKIVYNNIEEELKFISPLDSIVYKFDENLVIRGLDTILKTKFRKELFYSGDEVSHGSIDAIKLFFTKTPNQNYIFIYKENDAFSYLGGHGN